MTTAASSKTQTQCEQLGMTTTEKKRTFDGAFKLKVIDYASQFSNGAAPQMHERLGEAPESPPKMESTLSCRHGAHAQCC